MQPKDYQQRVLDRFERYLNLLASEQEAARRVEALRAENPGLDIAIPDWPAKAWETLRQEGQVGRDRPYSARTTGDGKHVPNVTLKIPTGGGKTMLAAHGVARVLNQFLARQSGLVLWIVPNDAIYSQTKRTLTDREHPYRQALDRAAGGKVRILEKDSPLDAADADHNICVLLLMLPSANRQTKETLRLFRDRGNVRGFFPPEGDLEAHEGLLRQVPNLDSYRLAELDADGATAGTGQIKDSLGNVLRLRRPVIVMDEGHKAFSDLAYRTLYGFNPSFVLELSATPADADRATPPRHANWLVNVTGTDLQEEDMIKMPINLEVRASQDWRDCLRAAWELTEALQRVADALQAESMRYIRPILLVQVERTGEDQRDSDYIHSEDAREALVALGVSPDAIAVKSSDKDELKGPGTADLLSPASPIRAIITKQALQEGWDCPFAYVLCSLAASRSVTALTQLVGRILRQPGAQRTGVQALDECYVFCYRQETAQVADAIVQGLKDDGMGDLAGQVRVSDAPAQSLREIRRRRRPSTGATPVYIPRVLWRAEPKPRSVDWWGDVLGWIDWASIDATMDATPAPPGSELPGAHRVVIDMPMVRHPGAGYQVTADSGDSADFDAVFATRAISDLVPNPWHARRLVDQYAARLLANGWTQAKLGQHSSHVIDSLKAALRRQVEAEARKVFEDHLRQGRIRFQLVASPWAWRMPESESVILTSDPRLLARRSDGQMPQRSWLEPLHENDLNGLELEVALYLDEQQTILWWYRNLVRESGYSLQGWRRERVYPDFLFAFQVDGSNRRLIALETKGEHLSGNEDTTYKQALFDTLNAACLAGDFETIGSLQIEDANNARLECRMAVQPEWRATVDAILARID